MSETDKRQTPVREVSALSAALGVSVRHNLLYFFIACAGFGIAAAMYEIVFNNFVYHTFGWGEAKRGLLEFPREFPGFLTASFAGALFFLSESRLGLLSALALGIGMIGLAFVGDSWAWFLIMILLWSFGTHLIMPVRSTLAMQMAPTPEERGKRLGQAQGIDRAAYCVGAVIVFGIAWLFKGRIDESYAILFIIGGCAACFAAIMYWRMQVPPALRARPKWVFKPRYYTFYILSLLFGARKQVFITFGPYVLVKVFGIDIAVMAMLLLIASLLGVMFQPALGRWIDRFGERTVLLVDAGLIVVVCLGYAFGEVLFGREIGVQILCVCFIADSLLFGTGMARDTYVSKIAETHADIAPTLSLGVSINHAVSMTFPFFGGWLMESTHYSWIFLLAAFIGLAMFFVAQKIPRKL